MTEQATNKQKWVKKKKGGGAGGKKTKKKPQITVKVIQVKKPVASGSPGGAGTTANNSTTNVTDNVTDINSVIAHISNGTHW